MVNSMIIMLHEMQHHIRMPFSNSSQSACHKTWKVPIAGIGQGNGAGPHIWAAVRSPLLDLMQQDGFYANMMLAISLQQKQLVSFTFVDDMDLCMFEPHVNTSNVQLTMQNSVDHWEGLLHATSSALIPSKCFWYFIDFQFINNTWKYVTKHQEPGEIQIKDKHQHRATIPCLELHENCHTLGVCLALGGHWDTEYNYLLLVTLDWKVKMATSKLNPTNATFSLQNVIFRKLVYPLVTTSLMQQQCHQIMVPILQQGLPKAGMIHMFPWALAHGPLMYGGLAIPHLYTEQMVAHIQTIL